MATEKVRRQHVFELLTPEQIRVLSEDAETIELETGKVIYERGDRADYIYIVLKGNVALRLPETDSTSILIDEVGEGNMFGSCVSLLPGSYFCTAESVQQTELLKIHTVAMKDVLDNDCCIGYAIQSALSRIYFIRYMEITRKLQEIIAKSSVESDVPISW